MDWQCRLNVSRTLVDGHWVCTEWSDCSLECGVGMAYSERFCD